jgi:hypothetical protein
MRRLTFILDGEGIDLEYRPHQILSARFESQEGKDGHWYRPAEPDALTFTITVEDNTRRNELIREGRL